MFSSEDPIPASAREAVSELYETLRAIAQSQMRHERFDHTLQATAVVHEAYLRLADVEESIWRDREHFVSVAAGTIRRVLVDHARAHNRDKRGGGVKALTIHSGIEQERPVAVDVLALDDALAKLGRHSPESVRLVELRFFGGLSIEQAADLMGMGRNTAVRRWRAARAWLKRELDGSGADDVQDEADHAETDESP